MRSERRYGPNVIELSEYRRNKQRENLLFRLSQLPRLLVGGILLTGGAGVVLLGGFRLISGLQNVEPQRESPKTEDSSTPHIIPLSRIDILKQYTEDTLGVLSDIVPTEPVQIRITDLEGVNERDRPDVIRGNRLRTGQAVPFYRVLGPDQRFLDGVFSQFIVQRDKYDKEVTKIWTVKWSSPDLDNGGLSYPTFFAVFDRHSGGWLVEFRDENAALEGRTVSGEEFCAAVLGPALALQTDLSK